MARQFPTFHINTLILSVVSVSCILRKKITDDTVLNFNTPIWKKNHTYYDANDSQYTSIKFDEVIQSAKANVKNSVKNFL